MALNASIEINFRQSRLFLPQSLLSLYKILIKFLTYRDQVYWDPSLFHSDKQRIRMGNHYHGA